MDKGLSVAVREVFVRLYEDGLIYRGEYLVNWCPRCSTAISDLEVEYSEASGKLWHLKYPVIGGDEFMVVATTRPETMLGDTAVAVHPEDERYSHLVGSEVLLPLMNRRIPIVADDFVDREFGTGAVKVTPGHDPNDFEAGRRNGLAIVKVIGEDATMTSEAGDYAGLDRYEAREKVVADLQKLELIEKLENHQHNVGCCQRCETVIEPLVSTQWFVKVKPLAETAIQAVEDGRTVFVPEQYKRVYFEWMRNIHDWCISRQLWWGHRIPAWYCGDCSKITVSRDDPDTCESCGGSNLRQESDVLDTWFSSGLWPFSTLGWPESTEELKVYYPTTTLVTGFDIIFFWVARMMMMGLKFQGDVPFRSVHINGLVRDEQGHKMSKSRGNVIDPLAIIDEYGADSIRFTLSVMAVPGTDIPFSESRMAGYRAFCNKIWNAGRFLLMNLDRNEPVGDAEIQALWESGRLPLEDRWILGRLQQMIASTNDNLEKFRFHEASNELYHFFWGEFCSWYIELVKKRISGPDGEGKLEASTVALYLLENSLRLLHPFIPFVTEELWQRLPHSGETLMLRPYPEQQEGWISAEDIQKMELLQELISAIRTSRTENRVPPGKRVSCELVCEADSLEFIRSQTEHLSSLARVSPVSFVESFDTGGIKVRGATTLAEFTILLDDVIDVEAEKNRVAKQIVRLENDVQQLARKLENSGFVERAPAEVVDGVRARHKESQELLEKMKRQLNGLS
jgi:valyl-tRNA synthetase